MWLSATSSNKLKGRRNPVFMRVCGISKGLLITDIVKRLFSLTSGRLNSYLTDIDEQSGNMFSQLIKEYADRQGVTEQLKARNQLEWVGKMNNIRNQAMEIVDKEILYPLIR